MHRMERVRIQRKRAGLEAADDALDPRIVPRGAPAHVERKEMLFGGMRTRGFRRLVAVGDQRRRVVGDEAGPQPFREILRVAQRLACAARPPSSRADCASCGPTR